MFIEFNAYLFIYYNLVLQNHWFNHLRVSKPTKKNYCFAGTKILTTNPLLSQFLGMEYCMNVWSSTIKTLKSSFLSILNFKTSSIVHTCNVHLLIIYCGFTVHFFIMVLKLLFCMIASFFDKIKEQLNWIKFVN